ncbi:MAG: type II 3-dehydroquinate dehydratase [Lachnospiraceae bacterium]|nr:type II 3-dehydroquinate dehydratase [Lachnospiraceae bacterium]
MEQKNILIINGPNLNLLGKREPEIYGSGTYEELLRFCEAKAERRDLEIEVFQSNHEGEIVDKIQQALGAFDGIIINAAAYTHTSIAILDALKAVGLPAVEVHLSDLSKREAFRQISYAGMACITSITGRGFEGYAAAMDVLAEHWENSAE